MLWIFVLLHSVCVLCPELPVSLDFLFLTIPPVFSNVYFADIERIYQPQNVPVISKISKLVWGVSALESQAVWAPWLSQNLFIAYILAVGSSNPSLVHSLIVWQLTPYIRTNQNHKQTYEFLIEAALLWLVHSNTKNQDYHLFILTIPL